MTALTPTSEPCETSDLTESFIRVQLAILSAHYGEEITEPNARIYIEHLSRFPLESLRLAFYQAIERCRYLPRIAEIIACLPENEEKWKRDDECRAWDFLQRSIERNGVDRWPTVHALPNGDLLVEKVEPLPPEIDWAVKQCGGYEAVATAERAKLKFIREDFIRHYNAYCEHEEGHQPPQHAARRMLAKLQLEQVFGQLAAVKTRKLIGDESAKPSRGAELQ